MQYSLVPKVYEAEIILLFCFLAYFLIHICGVNVTLEAVAHRGRPGKSPRAVDGANREVALCTRKMMYKKTCVPTGRGSKGQHITPLVRALVHALLQSSSASTVVMARLRCDQPMLVLFAQVGGKRELNSCRTETCPLPRVVWPSLGCG